MTNPVKPLQKAPAAAPRNDAPQDQALHDDIGARNREIARTSYAYDFLQQHSVFGFDYAPTHKGIGFSVQGGFDDALTRGGGRLGVGYTFPITRDLAFSTRVGIGGAYDGSEAIKRFTVEGSLGAELAYMPNERWRFAVNGKIVGRATFSLDIDKAQYAVADLDGRAQAIGARVQSLIAGFRSTLASRFASLGPDARAAVTAEFARLGAALPGAVMAAILDPNARGGVATLVRGAATNIQNAIGDSAADFVRDISAAADNLIDQTGALIDREISRVEDGFSDASFAGSLHARAGFELSARLPLWEPHTDNQGGGLYFVPSLSAAVDIPLAGSGTSGIVPGDPAPDRYRLSVAPGMNLQFAIPYTTVAIDAGVGMVGSLSKKRTVEGQPPESFKADPLGVHVNTGLSARF